MSNKKNLAPSFFVVPTSMSVVSETLLDMILPGEVLQKLKIKHVKGQNTSKFYIAEFVSETNTVYIYIYIRTIE